MGVSCLEDLSGHLQMMNYFWLATCWAADFLLERLQIQLYLIFQRWLFKDFSGYPFEDNGGFFCSFCRREFILAMTGSEDSDCIDCEVSTEFHLLISLR